jgi:formylglycine-generating enzyme required for sulfatase activity
MALVRLDRPATVWPLLKHSADPTLRSQLIHRFAPWGVDVQVLLRQLDSETDVTAQRALLLSLGGYSDKQWPPAQRQALLPRLKSLYQTAADPGLHAAAEWLLRRWQQEPWLAQVNEQWARDSEKKSKTIENIISSAHTQKGHAAPRWYVNGQGQTMVAIAGPVEFLMGSPPSEVYHQEQEVLHRRRIGRTFAIASKPVTVAQFLRFRKNHMTALRKIHSPVENCPVVAVTWYEAALYCNWLSEQEGIPADQWCYQTDRRQTTVTHLKPNYLSLTGYRLATEAEWEYACRAGTATAWYYGDAEALLGQYGWFGQNGFSRTWPVGSLKPNDLGLFDMHGNVWCWCQEQGRSYPAVGADQVVEDAEEKMLLILDQNDRVLRGGTIFQQAAYLRSASRFGMLPPALRLNNIGFRPTRTLAGA